MKNMLNVEPPVIPLLTKVMLRIIATTMKARKGTGGFAEDFEIKPASKPRCGVDAHNDHEAMIEKGLNIDDDGVDERLFRIDKGS